MASVRTVLLLLPPFSVLFCMAVRCLGRVAARKLTVLARAHFACPPASSSFRYLLSVEKGEEHHAIRREPPVAQYRRGKHKHRASRSCVGEDPEEEECVFCLSGIEEGEEIRELKCRHLFHRGCLDRWLLARPLQATCPLCRCRLLASSSPVSEWAAWEVADYYGYDDDEGEEDSDMMLFMACVHSRSSWFWPS